MSYQLPEKLKPQECCSVLVHIGLMILPRCPKGFCGTQRLLRDSSQQLICSCLQQSLTALFSWSHADLRNKVEDLFLYYIFSGNHSGEQQLTADSWKSTVLDSLNRAGHGLFAPFFYLLPQALSEALTFSPSLLQKASAFFSESLIAEF